MSTAQGQQMFEGRIWPLSVRLAVPLMLANFVSFFYSFVDTAFISLIDRSSTAIISGMGLVIPIFILALALSTGLGMGVSAVVARGVGEKNETVLRRAASSGFLIAVGVSLVVLTASYLFGKRIIALLAGPALSSFALEKAWEYLVFILPGFFFLMAGRVLIGILQGEGLNRKIAMALAISTGSNLVLDPLFIFGLRMGVGGAALATTVAILVAGLYVLPQFRAGRTRTALSFNLFRAEPRLLLEILRTGMPPTIGQVAEGVSFLLLNRLVSSIGEAAMNSWTLCIRTDLLLLIPVLSLSGANLTMIGQNYGRGEIERVRRIYRSNALLAAGMLVGFAGLYAGLAPYIFHAFSSLPEVVAGSVRQVRVLAFSFVGTAVAVITVTTFQATGHAGRAMVVTVARLGLVSVPVAYLLASLTDWGMWSVYLAVGISNLTILVLSSVWGSRTLGSLRFRTVT
jgi:putative MATE family efflux protein